MLVNDLLYELDTMTHDFPDIVLISYLYDICHLVQSQLHLLDRVHNAGIDL